MKKVFSLMVITIFITSLVVIGTSNFLYGLDKTSKDVTTKKCAHAVQQKAKATTCCSNKTKYECTKQGCKYTSDKPGKCPHCQIELKKSSCCSDKSGKTAACCSSKKTKKSSEKKK